jgi:cytochrome b6-f complex iron-sulfur subunit
VNESGIDNPTTRRALLDWFLRACGTILGVGLVGPALAYLWPSARKGPVQHRQDVGAEQGWAVWAGKTVSVGEKPVVVVRTSTEFRAFSAVCTHLGCLIDWDASRRLFDCPCHGGTFDLNGRVTGGPPPRPLPEFAVSVVDGKVFVSG